MDIGMIGAGKVGCSMGKYMREHGLPVAGYFSRSIESSQIAGTFTGTEAFGKLEDLVRACDILCIATPDDVIGSVWSEVRQMSLKDKILCHFSGSYSSAVFSGIGNTGADACSVHPMYAFSDKFTSYQQLHTVLFTIEGGGRACHVMRGLFSAMGNKLLDIDPKKKALYHCSASVVSNFMVALLQMGLNLLGECGIDEKSGLELIRPLVEHNVQNALEYGPAGALTGPIERGDLHTVETHLAALDGEEKILYRLLGKRALEVARIRNPNRDYQDMSELLKND